ncbi:hypothetical protein GCM10022205_21340 [Spinactinospora alkalitolerans]
MEFRVGWCLSRDVEVQGSLSRSLRGRAVVSAQRLATRKVAVPALVQSCGRALARKRLSATFRAASAGALTAAFSAVLGHREPSRPPACPRPADLDFTALIEKLRRALFTHPRKRT